MKLAVLGPFFRDLGSLLLGVLRIILIALLALLDFHDLTAVDDPNVAAGRGHDKRHFVEQAEKDVRFQREAR